MLILIIAGAFFSAMAQDAPLSVPANFGKTHFIIGHDHTKKGVTFTHPVQETTYCSDPLIPCWQQEQSCTICQAFFSPRDNIKKILIDLIEREQKSIRIASFMVTDKEIAQALINAHKHKVKIELITDAGSYKEKFSKVPLLQQEDIAVYLYKSHNENGIINDIMHHKFVIFEQNVQQKSLVWTGSFNFTKSANQRNQENVIVIEDKDIVQQYAQQFEHLKKTLDRHKLEKITVAPQLNRDQLAYAGNQKKNKGKMIA